MELTSPFLLYRGLVHHHNRILKWQSCLWEGGRIFSHCKTEKWRKSFPLSLTMLSLHNICSLLMNTESHFMGSLDRIFFLDLNICKPPISKIIDIFAPYVKAKKLNGFLDIYNFQSNGSSLSRFLVISWRICIPLLC